MPYDGSCPCGGITSATSVVDRSICSCSHGKHSSGMASITGASIVLKWVFDAHRCNVQHCEDAVTEKLVQINVIGADGIYEY